LSEREENFVQLGVDVKGKRNLAEGLLGFIQGDLLSGDNKYECAVCNKKVDAVKRVCLNKLPDTLVFSLKRFAFNYDTFVREKVNSHYDFPHELDLWDYSRKGLAAAEGKVCFCEKKKIWFAFCCLFVVVEGAGE
jgi:ubiquitin C-terminal hydrolase